jgi:tRNA(adenine34) deaminase
MSQFTTYMDRALAQARAAAARGEVPVGAVIVTDQGEILAETGNHMRALADPTAHAEILAIRTACAALANERLTQCDLYVTLEPCPMCAGAIAAARLRRVYYGASDPKSGGVGQGPCIFDHPQSHHKPEVISGLSERACETLLKDFFAKRRA